MSVYVQDYPRWFIYSLDGGIVTTILLLLLTKTLHLAGGGHKCIHCVHYLFILFFFTCIILQLCYFLMNGQYFLGVQVFDVQCLSARFVNIFFFHFFLKKNIIYKNEICG